MKVTLVIVAVVAALLVSVVVASEVQSSGTVRSRDEIMKCAQDWCDKKIPYCQCNGPEECCGSCPHCPKYRCDCSGYVSFCLGLSYGYVTSTLHEVTHPISQDELQRGDIMLCASDHVVFFGGWTDGSKTNYIAYQEPGCHTTGPHYAFKSVVPYPFNWNPSCFLPYRLNGLGAEAVHADGTCEHNMATKEDLMEAFFNPSSFPLKHAKEGLEASRKIKEHQGSLKL